MPSSHRLIHERLMHPANAVPDPGIHMHNGWPVRTPTSSQPQNVPAPPPSQPAPVRPEPSADFWLSLPWTVNLSVPAPPPPVKYVTVSAVIRAVARTFDVPMEELKGPRRVFPLTLYRQMACALVRRLTDRSLPEIGQYFGGRDHSTILHAVRKMAPHMDAVAAELDADASPMDWARAMRQRLEEADEAIP